MNSEEHEDLSDVTFNVLYFFANNVESDSLRKRSALANSNDITDFDTESWGAVSWNSVVALLKTIVLFDVMEVVTSDNDCALHLGRNDDTSKVQWKS